MTVKACLCAHLTALVVASVPSGARAQGAADDLLGASLQELMDIRVTSVARKSQRAEDAPAAIYVITRSDIRLSGLRSLPEILRLAPGVQVAQISASAWAVSIRGFNSRFANKLLVLVDGRSVYTRAFSGVFWDMQDTMVSDIDRIEVIRGPGGAIWGANAVNGVINIITRPAADTQGFAAEVSTGTFERDRLGLRYGGTIGRGRYRAFSQLSGHSNSHQPDPVQSSDHWRTLTTGARLDWSNGADALVVQGDFRRIRTRPGWANLASFDPRVPAPTDGVTRGEGGNIIGRWTRTGPSGRVLQVQGFHTITRRDETIIRVVAQTSDIDAQYETTVGVRHGLVFGGGYRHANFSTDGSLSMHLGPARLGTFNLFLQDEVVLSPSWVLTLGSKVEHDTFAGWGQMPSARVLWKVSPHQRLWAAVSRARRTPALADRDFRFNVVVPGPGLPLVVALTGNSEYAAERLLQTEAGYRVRVASNARVEATVFSGRYDGLKTEEPLGPVLEPTPTPVHLLAQSVASNLLHARASGVELNAGWQPVRRWQIDGSYSWLHITNRAHPTSRDLTPSHGGDQGVPAHQWQLRSTFALRPRIEIGGWIARVGRLGLVDIPGYTRLDARAEFRLNRRLTASVGAHNLLSRHHPEFSTVTLISSVPRSARAELRWMY